MRDGIDIGVTAWTVDGRGPETLTTACALGFAAIHLDSGVPDGDQCLEDPVLRDAYREAAADTAVRIVAIAVGGDAVLGEGEAGFLDTARALRANGFRGTLISENDYQGARAANAARDIAVLSAAFGLDG